MLVGHVPLRRQRVVVVADPREVALLPVGSAACRTCHAPIYERWSRTRASIVPRMWKRLELLSIWRKAHIQGRGFSCAHLNLGREQPVAAFPDLHDVASLRQLDEQSFVALTAVPAPTIDHHLGITRLNADGEGAEARRRWRISWVLTPTAVWRRWRTSPRRWTAARRRSS